MKEKNAILMMGLPLSGKSTWILKNIDMTKFTKVSADDHKESHPEYDPEQTQLLHEWSVEQAENDMNDLAEQGSNMIMDSGGINNRYTIRIMKMLKSHGYLIKLVYIKTPYEVCLERNESQSRERKVPAVAITDKALKQTSQFHKLDKLSDTSLIVDYFTNKHIFVDMDGVIAAQSTLPIVNGEIDFVNGEIHKWQKPVKPVIDLLETLRKNNQTQMYILSATPNSVSSSEKLEWLEKNFPMKSDRIFFVNQGKHKAEMLDNLRRKFKLEFKDILLIDDVHETLYKVKKRGMNAMHPSEFLTHEF